MSIDKREFRAWVRTHHPDVGGDPEEFAAELDLRRARLDRCGSGAAGGSGEGAVVGVSVFRSRGGLWLLSRWWRRRRHGRRVL